MLIGCLSPGETRLPGGTYKLQPSSDGSVLDEWQEIEVTHPKGRQKLLAHVLNTSTKTNLTVLDPSTLATLAVCTYEGGRASLTGPAASSDIPSELPMAILQLTSWPSPSIQRGLSGGLRITTLGDQRVITNGVTALAEIEVQANRSYFIRLPGHATTIKVTPAQQP
jgi:hypothetical protein